VTDIFSRLAVRAISYPELAVRAKKDFDIDGREAESDASEPAPEPGPAPLTAASSSPAPATESDLKYAPINPVPVLIPMPTVIPPTVPADPATGAQSQPGTPSDSRRSASPTPTSPTTAPTPLLTARCLPEVSESATESREFPAAVAPALRPTAPIPAQPPRRQSEPSAVPTRVEVTIDRLEVRVRPPASPHARPRAVEPVAATALTLEEYLRKRETGS
jgi:hypothetical protein